MYPQPTSPQFVDAAFPVHGNVIPLDHGYHLFAALCRHIPELRAHREWAVHPVFGSGHSEGVLQLSRRSRLRIRLPATDVSSLLPLSQTTLTISGHSIRVGFPQLYPLRSAPNLQARYVHISGCTDSPEQFGQAVGRNLAQIPDLYQDPARIEITVGPRRILRIKDSPVVGYAVALGGLEAHGSIAVQCHGLGGRRHMGAGIFVPPRRGVRHTQGVDNTQGPS